MKTFFKSPSGIVLILLIGLLLGLRCSFQQWKAKDLSGLITWDDAGYYAYLPATFIYDDLDHMTFMDSMNVKYPMAPQLYMLHESPIGKRYIMYPSGVAVIEAPWFFIGHAWAKLSNYPADGYSPPYKISLAFGMLFYAFLGLVVIRKLVLLFFTENVTAMVLVIITLGTNFLLFASWFNTNAHVPNFLFLALAIYLSIKWLAKPTVILSLMLGANLALCTMIRPSDILIVCFPLLFGVVNINHFKQRIEWIITNYRHTLLLSLAGFAVGSIQLYYWHRISGKWIFFSYPGEWFDFTQPHLMNVLFSYEKGWLLYSPVLIIPLVVLLRQFRRPQAYTYACLLVMLLGTYIISAWSNWWYGGGGFGHRAFIDLYPFLALPMAAGLTWMLNQKKGIRTTLISLVGVLTALSVFQHWQWHNRINHVATNTKEAYWQGFTLIDVEDVDPTLRSDNFSKEDVALLNPDDFLQKKLASINLLTKRDSTFIPLEINKDNLFSPAFKVSFQEANIPETGAWLVIKTKLHIRDTNDLKNLSMITCCTDKKERTSYHYAKDDLIYTNLLPNSDIEIVTRTPVPKTRFKNDVLSIYLYNTKSSDIHVGVQNIDVIVMTARKSKKIN